MSKAESIRAALKAGLLQTAEIVAWIKDRYGLDVLPKQVFIIKSQSLVRVFVEVTNPQQVSYFVHATPFEPMTICGNIVGYTCPTMHVHGLLMALEEVKVKFMAKVAW
jgi:hypothetical protein